MRFVVDVESSAPATRVLEEIDRALQHCFFDVQVSMEPPVPVSAEAVAK